MYCGRFRRHLLHKSLLSWLLNAIIFRTIAASPPTSHSPSSVSPQISQSHSAIRKYITQHRKQRMNLKTIYDITNDSQLVWLPNVFNLTSDVGHLRNTLLKMDGSEYSLQYLLPFKCLLSIVVAEYSAFAPEISFFVTCGDIKKSAKHEELISCIYSGAHIDSSRKFILKYLRGQSEDDRCPRGHTLIALHERIAYRLGALISVLDDESFYILKSAPLSSLSNGTMESRMAAKHVPGTRSSGTVSQADGRGVDRIRSIVYETLFSDKLDSREPRNYYTKYGYQYVFQSNVQRTVYHWAVEYIQQVSITSTLQQVFHSNHLEMGVLRDIFHNYNVSRMQNTQLGGTKFDTLAQLLQYLCRFDVMRSKSTSKLDVDSTSLLGFVKEREMEHCRYILRQVFIRYRLNVFKVGQDIGLWDALDILNAIVPMQKYL